MFAAHCVRKLATAALFVFASSASAVTVDFTSQEWKSAVGSQNASATVGDVTVTSLLPAAGNLTFNASNAERADCIAGQASHGLACWGDGLGVGNSGDDEITQGGIEILRVTFFNPVNILGVDFLDLFGSEKTGEAAMMTDSHGATYEFKAAPGNRLNGKGAQVAGGYWASGYSSTNVTSLSFFGKKDTFSDFALARVTYDVKSVPEIDGSHTLLVFGLLLACVGISRERRRARSR